VFVRMLFGERRSGGGGDLLLFVLIGVNMMVSEQER